jgi:hypothetical protein
MWEHDEHDYKPYSKRGCAWLLYAPLLISAFALLVGVAMFGDIRFEAPASGGAHFVAFLVGFITTLAVLFIWTLARAKD